MLIEFSKMWGRDNFRWNYCGGDWNFRTIIGFMEFYGIKEAWVSGNSSYINEGKEIACLVYSGYATKHLDILKKHWTVDYCKQVSQFEFKPIKSIF